MAGLGPGPECGDDDGIAWAGDDTEVGPTDGGDVGPDAEAPEDNDDEDGGCQGGAPSPGLSGLFMLGMVALQRRRAILSS